MTRAILPRLAAGVGVLLALTSSAPAETISWSYSWPSSTTSVSSDGLGSSSIAFNLNHAMLVSGSSDIIAANLRTFSNASPLRPDFFTEKAYSLILFIHDYASGINGAATFTGVLNGTLSAHSATIRNRYTSPLEQQLHLGSHLYTIDLGRFSPPGPPDSTNLGSITVRVNVQHNPEPSSLILAGIGVSVLGWSYRKYGTRRFRGRACL